MKRPNNMSNLTKVSKHLSKDHNFLQKVVSSHTYAGIICFIEINPEFGDLLNWGQFWAEIGPPTRDKFKCILSDFDWRGK